MSVTSSTDICNLALDLLNAGTVGNIVEGDTPIEEALNRWYDQTRRKLLREHTWNFATKRALLAASATPPAFGFGFSYPLPSDFVRINSVLDGNGHIMSKTQYQIEGKSILISNEGGALPVLYIYDITDVNKFDALFIDCLSLDIALSIANKVTDSKSNVQLIAELQKQRKMIARAIDGQESPPTRREVSRIITARRVNGSFGSHLIEF
jgi:hypothetical protein